MNTEPFITSIVYEVFDRQGDVLAVFEHLDQKSTREQLLAFPGSHYQKMCYDKSGELVKIIPGHTNIVDEPQLLGIIAKSEANDGLLAPSEVRCLVAAVKSLLCPVWSSTPEHE